MTLRRAFQSALALAFLSLAACGSRPPAEEPRPAAPPAPRKPPGIPVGVVLMQQDQFFRLNEAGMREAAEGMGVDLRVQNAAGALDKEVAIVETFVTQRARAILVSPLSSEASIPALKAAHDAGIHVITYNNGLAADFPVFSITSDQRSLGATSGLAARALVESKLGGKAKIALIGFRSQLPEQGGARQDGFKSAFDGMAGVEFIAEQDAWEAPQAANVVGELLVKKPDIVWAANEGGTVGAVTAVRNAGLQGQVVVFGTDSSTQIIDFLLADDGVLHAVTAQAPLDMGRRAVAAAVKAVKNEPVEKTALLSGILFSRDQPDLLRAERARLEAASR